MIKIHDFAMHHVNKAQELALMNYNEERAFVPSLPPLDKLPGLEYYTKHNLNVAATDGDQLLGFMCCHEPWDDLFGLCKGTCSDVHAHGAVKQNRAYIYDRLYQAAAEKWVAADVFSHCVILYEHDLETNDIFFKNGFGRRCVDAMRETTPITVSAYEGVTFRQAINDDADFIAMAGNQTGIHLSGSPMFMPYDGDETSEDAIKGLESGEYPCFIALEKNRPVAFFCIRKNGENFASDDSSVMNICGAYALPEVRGRGISEGLLSWLMDWLREQGYARCGVDYECFNYTARKFWGKYFTPYTNGAVRRIDERINKNNKGSIGTKITKENQVK